MFKPTENQKKSLALTKTENILKIEAVAGSGKTSTLKYIADNMYIPMLYLAYNKSMAMDARAKFPSNVDVKSVHGLAYREVGNNFAHKLSRPLGRYRNVASTGNEISLYYKIPDMAVGDKKIPKAFIGLIVKDTVNAYEQSADPILIAKHIPSRHKTDIQKRFPALDWVKLEKMLVKKAKNLWEDRSDIFSDVLCTHDTYLKLFQLSKPVLNGYKVILLDEAQDSNQVTLDIVLSQQKHSKIVLVGDKRQAIYGWRGAINAMEQVTSEGVRLDQSFRFGEEIADLCSHILKEPVKGNPDLNSKAGYINMIDETQHYTILFRRNITLIYHAIILMQEGKVVDINIDVKDFVSMLHSAHCLFLGNARGVKHEAILPYACWDDLLTEAKSDPELTRISQIIRAGETDSVLETLRTYDRKKKPDVTLTTAHKAKGLEYDYVLLAEDFPSVFDERGKFIGLNGEEQNLLYVATSRAKKVLQYNTTVRDILLMNGVTHDKINRGLPVDNVKMAVIGADSSGATVEAMFDKLVPKTGDNYNQAYENWLEEEGSCGDWLGQVDKMPTVK